jgi:thiosulfate/3-mercaptopyruvate sulfurtransferase
MTSAPASRAGQHRILSPEELMTSLAGEDLVLLDVRYPLSPGPRPEYFASRLPGAQHVDCTSVLPGNRSTSTGAWRLPTLEALTTELRSRGVHDDTLVVAYGDHKGVAAGRVAWVLEWAGHPRTAWVDGGYDAWWRQGLPTEDGAPTPPTTGHVTLSPGRAPTCADDELLVAAAHGQAVDVRSRSRFRTVSAVPGTAAPLRLRSVPGMVNVPATAFGDQAGRALDGRALSEVLRRARVDPSEPVVLFCDDGTSSGWATYLARRAGLDARLYVGA